MLFALVAFIGGLAGLLTPCVFPMIPMTVTFFLKNAKDKKKGMFQGMFYGFSIIAIYTLIGTIFTVIFGATGANEFSTNAGVNIAFFLIFVIFAISFFGAFEITLPSAFVNKIDRQSDKGGLIGVFFMAFTLVLVSFSCTGPIVGTILVEASQGGVIRPIVGMIGFSLAFALPFTLFAIFPQWLNSLPKSGGWLNSVKVVLGFVELALGLKFLSVADQVYHWGLLDREIYIGIWIVLSILCGLYLLGKIKFAHDSELKFLGVPRLFFAITTFAFVFYLIPGLFGAALPGLAGYLPPTTSHGFNLPALINGTKKGNICEEPKYSDFLHLPHGIKGYFDYKQAIACARTLEKPLFIDFTGHGCVNCRKMEDRVWANPEILKMLQEDFVVVALYVDDRTEADSADWVLSKHDGKLKKTIGRINADLQICKFNHIAQPYYVLLDNEEELLAEPIGSEYDVVKFRKFLDGAKRRFNKKLEAKKRSEG
ncbi:MAG TPA: disulfide bond formation protein DsbD [Bacteroidetes bacterium]|nr:disulfide bond formation protein DsbD [Bacteroidota bacterium]